MCDEAKLRSAASELAVRLDCEPSLPAHAARACLLVTALLCCYAAVQPEDLYAFGAAYFAQLPQQAAAAGSGDSSQLDQQQQSPLGETSSPDGEQ